MEHPELKIFHNHNGGIAWKLQDDGVFVENSGVERTPGVPTTVKSLWETHSSDINHWASHYKVCCELILATICTESGGNQTAIREEPGYKSDQETPHKVSVGLMQTLISTAREVVGDPNIDRQWLLQSVNSIQAGTAYISQQREQSQLDPPKVACAYNAGGIYDNDGPANRWKMRQYPIGTSAHCDRFVRWFNDAVEVLREHRIRPELSFEDVLR